VALVNDQFYVVGDGWVFQFDITTWGWVHLLLGIVIALDVGAPRLGAIPDIDGRHLGPAGRRTGRFGAGPQVFSDAADERLRVASQIGFFGSLAVAAALVVVLLVQLVRRRD
jgi:hypothetical protein